LIVFARAGLGLKRGAPPDEALSPAAVKLRKQLEYQLKKKREEELWMKSKVYPREENESRRKIRFFSGGGFFRRGVRKPDRSALRKAEEGPALTSRSAKENEAEKTQKTACRQ
jgi:hypothetical protein